MLIGLANPDLVKSNLEKEKEIPIYRDLKNDLKTPPLKKKLWYQ